MVAPHTEQTSSEIGLTVSHVPHCQVVASDELSVSPLAGACSSVGLSWTSSITGVGGTIFMRKLGLLVRRRHLYCRDALSPTLTLHLFLAQSIQVSCLAPCATSMVLAFRSPWSCALLQSLRLARALSTRPPVWPSFVSLSVWPDLPLSPANTGQAACSPRKLLVLPML